MAHTVATSRDEGHRGLLAVRRKVGGGGGSITAATGSFSRVHTGRAEFPASSGPYLRVVCFSHCANSYAPLPPRFRLLVSHTDGTTVCHSFQILKFYQQHDSASTATQL